MVNIESQIRRELWGAISNSYLAENYTNSIKDAMSFLTEILRDKSGEDGDGYQLVGKVLGFSHSKRPKIQINKLQTETEQSMQKGLEEILRGMYRLVRNPRSHEQISDTKETADAIVLFINYLLDFLGESTYTFTIEEYVSNVTDNYFVTNRDYADGLVEKIPVRKINDTLIAVYRAKGWRNATNFELVIKSILERINDNESILENFFNVVSEEIQYTEKASDVSLIIKMIPPHLWPRVNKLSRMRAENILLKDLEIAWVNPSQGETTQRACTWIVRILNHFLLIDDLRKTILAKIRNVDFDHQNMIAAYFMRELPMIFTETDTSHILALSNAIKNGNKVIKNAIEDFYEFFPTQWKNALDHHLKQLHDKESNKVFSLSSSINLELFVRKDNPANQEEDDIPF
ncbi:TIGR02391 family protein [Candidatus Leptofilum sp.]|uniref:TIGR02391 family protein n=1 Tax=Candidatus Leptofilum sp. TaxID=3241576 RepID=UPI003B5B1457